MHIATRNDRIGDFRTDQDPADNVNVEVLCEDHVGTYVLPFPCCRENGAWLNAATRELVLVSVLGWRPHEARAPRGRRDDGAD